MQSKALSLATDQRGYAYFMEMGLGKTGVILNEITDLFIKDEINAAVVVAPNSILTNWKREAEKMGFKGEVRVWPNVGKSLGNDLTLYVMNYEATITKNGDGFLKRLFESRKVYFALDESSSIKNHSSKRSAQMLYYSRRAKYTRIATGTPITQSVADLWSQLTFIGVLNSRFYAFRNHFCEMGGFMGKQIVGVKNEEKLQGLLRKCAFTAKKKDWTDLPDQIFPSPRMSELVGAQKKAYQDMWEHFYVEISDEEGVEVNMAINQLQKLQQITSGFLYKDDHEAHLFFDNPAKIPKMKAMMEAIDEIEGKFIVFAFHKPAIQMCLEVLEKYNPAHIVGGMKSADRDYNINKFNDDDSCGAMVSQIGSGGIGLTLLAKEHNRCSNTLFYENDFSLEKRLQAEGRNHRHGQDRPVTYTDFVCSSVETRVIAALQAKQDLANMITDPVLWKPD